MALHLAGVRPEALQPPGLTLQKTTVDPVFKQPGDSMDFAGYADDQKQALLDLLLFGMYLDGNLSAIEDRRIGELLDTMTFSSPDARDRFLDAAYTRTRQRSNSPEGIRSFAAETARNIPTPDLRRRTVNLLESMLSSDNSVVEPERRLLAVVREEFGLRPASG
jgi:uncharacterized tellurite resistance protein B-like protein